MEFIHDRRWTGNFSTAEIDDVVVEGRYKYQISLLKLEFCLRLKHFSKVVAKYLS